MSKEALIVALADLHCGHIGGITPPDYWFAAESTDPKRAQWAEVQRELWNTYFSLAQEYRRPDVLIVNGDLIDGRGERTGGTELITSDLEAQCHMAAEALEIWDAKRIICSYGTPYHTGHAGQDWEKHVIDILGEGAEIHSHPFLKVGKITFDIKHFGGSSYIPYGKPTALGRQWLYNILWAMREEQPLAQIILRAHIHSAAFVGGFRPDWIAFFQPALQAAMTKWGARMCSNTVDWGILVFHVDGEHVDWKARVMVLEANRTEPIEINL